MSIINIIRGIVTYIFFYLSTYFIILLYFTIFS